MNSENIKNMFNVFEHEYTMSQNKNFFFNIEERADQCNTDPSEQTPNTAAP